MVNQTVVDEVEVGQAAMTTSAAAPYATTVARIRAVFAGAGARGFLHAVEIDAEPGREGREICVDADEPVVLASVFKIPVALAYAREVAAGRIDPLERTRVTIRDRTGGIGTAGCRDDVEMSWRDLALVMMTMSDNAATDTVLRRVGIDAVRGVLAELGLKRTRLIGGCEELFSSVMEDLGAAADAPFEEALAAVGPEQIWGLSVLDPARTTASTPREITALLTAIWRDEAGPSKACADVRGLMAQQIWPHRLSSGFPDGVSVAGKTGTVPSVRNEAGVVAYPDGRRFAVSVFTRAVTLAERAPAVDASIGAAARIAVDRLRMPL